MAQQGNVSRVRTLSTVNFTGALASGVAAFESLDVGTMPGGSGWGLAAGKHMKSRLRELRIISIQNLAWAVELWGDATGVGTGAIDTQKFLGRWEFAAADGRQVAGDTTWRYWVPGLDLSYQDLVLAGKLYVRLINLDAVAKIAGASGAIVLEFALEPTLGW